MRSDNFDYTVTLSILEGEILAAFWLGLAWLARLGSAANFLDLIIKVIFLHRKKTRKLSGQDRDGGRKMERF